MRRNGFPYSSIPAKSALRIVMWRAQVSHFAWLEQRLVDHPPSRFFQIERPLFVGPRAALDHANENNVINGIGPEPGTISPVPEVSTFSHGNVGFSAIDHHRAVIPIAHAQSWTVVIGAFVMFYQSLG